MLGCTQHFDFEQKPFLAMWQFGNAAVRQCWKVRGFALIAVRGNGGVPLRRPATHGRASYISALPHYQIV
jgi:hypothetical protein